MKLTRGRVLALAALLAALLLTAGLLTGLAASRRAARPASAGALRGLPVQTLGLVPGDSYTVRREYTGQLEPRRRSRLSFESAGKLVEIGVDDGGAVAAGAILARLDTRRLEAERRRLLRERDGARSLLEEMLAGPRQETIERARSELASQEARHERLERLAARYRTKELAGAVAEDQIDAAIFDARAARGVRDRARAELEELLAGTRKETIAAQRARVGALEAQIEAVDVELSRSVLRAPFAGKIERRLLDEGAVAGAGEEVLSIIENGRLEARVGVPVDCVSRFQVGAAEDLTVAGRQYPSRVAAILPSLDPATRTVEVVLELAESAGGGLIPGQIARLAVSRTVPSSGYWVPATALVEGRRGLWALYRVRESGRRPEDLGSRLERVDVEVLHHERERVFVRGPLLPGERVVTAGVDRVVHGQVVKVLDGGDIPAAID